MPSHEDPDRGGHTAPDRSSHTDSDRGSGARSRARLRPLSDQVVVITGGSSGIGRETAGRLAAHGATVVVLSRDEDGLAATVAEITHNGGDARYLVCDVTDLPALQSAADRVEQWYGRIDTWVNDAGVLMYARFWDTSPDEFRRMLEINFMGAIHGALVALPALRRSGGGALITVTSVEAVMTLPMHSAYAASKHALEGALDGLRRELIADRAPISVTAVRPAVIDTPIYPHARNRMRRRPQAPPPYYDPAVVAMAIAFAAEHPVRTVHAGGGGRFIALAQAVAPTVVDAVFGRFGIRFMHTDQPVPANQGNLDDSVGDARVRGGLPRAGRRWSGYTWLAVHPVIRRAAVLSLAALGGRMLLRRRR